MSFLGNILGVAGKAASLVPAVGPVAGSVISGLGSALGSSINQADDRDYAKKLWDAQNAYNTPAMQADRLRKAGLNPNMLMGQVGNSGSATTLPDSVKVSDSNSNNHAMDAMMSMMSSLSQIAVNQSETNKNNSQVPVNRSIVPLNQSIQDVNLSQVDVNRAHSALTDLQSENQKLHNGLLAKYGDKRSVAELDNLIQDTALKSANVLNTSKDIEVKASEIIKNYAAAHNLNASSRQIMDMLPYTINSLKESIVSQSLQNALQGNELSWQNGENSMSKFGYGNNYQQMRNTQLQQYRQGLKGTQLQNTFHGMQNSTYYIDKIMDIIKTGAAAGSAATFIAR